jgi:hypothetical protein
MVSVDVVEIISLYRWVFVVEMMSFCGWVFRALLVSQGRA